MILLKGFNRPEGQHDWRPGLVWHKGRVSLRYPIWDVSQ
jgi:hypothetical protein